MAQVARLEVPQSISTKLIQWTTYWFGSGNYIFAALSGLGQLKNYISWLFISNYDLSLPSATLSVVPDQNSQDLAQQNNNDLNIETDNSDGEINDEEWLEAESDSATIYIYFLIIY